MPQNIPAPELCEDEDVVFRRLATKDSCTEHAKQSFLARAEVAVESRFSLLM
jgi:hypothetical protein